MNKRGSHVGMVISFLIFILFLIFIYAALQPAIKLERDKKVILEGVKNKIINYFDVNLTTVIIEVKKQENPGAGIDCLKFNLNKIILDPSEKSFFVRTIDGNPVEFNIENNQLKIEWDGNSGVFYKIYISEQNFSSGLFSPTNCVDFTELDYEIRATQKEKYLGLDKIIYFMNHSVENKEANKEYLRVPKDSEFDISVVSDEINFPYPENNLKTNVYSEEIPLKYLNNQARIVPFFMRIRVW
ncbi:hypothetical protein J4474_04755 [Candidatus Pacearchaeota archaeon]|nr:hypothetical protein [Candidatus Pacearchaeota archaeon]